MTVCDKCGSKSLYRDDDHVNGVWDIACRMCGKRWPAGADPKTSKKLRIQQEEMDMKRGPSKAEPAAAPASDAAKPAEKKTRAQSTEKKPRRRPCDNCGRNLFIVAHGRCFTCERAAVGYSGDALTAALAEFKRRIDAGEIRKGGPGRRAKQIDAPKAAIKPKVEGSVKTDPGSGAIDAAGTLGPAPKVEGLAFLPDSPLWVFSVIVNFVDDDQGILDGLQALARKYRRTPDQQLLWLLEKELHNERLIESGLEYGWKTRSELKKEVSHGIDAPAA